MENIINFDLADSITGEVVQWVTIDRGNGEYTSMLKSTYDEMIAAQASLNPTEQPTCATKIAWYNANRLTLPRVQGTL